MGYQTDVAAGVSSQIAIGYSTVTTGQYAIAIGNDVSGAGDVLSFGKSGSVITSWHSSMVAVFGYKKEEKY